MGGLELDVFGDTPTANPNGPPPTSSARAARPHPFGVRLRWARCARLRYALPRMGEDAGKDDTLQKDFYTGSRIATKNLAEMPTKGVPGTGPDNVHGLAV